MKQNKWRVASFIDTTNEFYSRNNVYSIGRESKRLPPISGSLGQNIRNARVDRTILKMKLLRNFININRNPFLMFYYFIV